MSEMAGVETPETGPGVTYQGVIAIEWPETRPGFAPLAGWGISVFDALSGKQVTTVTAIKVHASATGGVTADVTMFTDEDGQPVYSHRKGEPWPGEGTFPFLVAEMRVRPAEPDRGALAPRFLAEPCAS